jgi:hypothetical protein
MHVGRWQDSPAVHAVLGFDFLVSRFHVRCQQSLIAVTAEQAQCVAYTAGRLLIASIHAGEVPPLIFSGRHFAPWRQAWRPFAAIPSDPYHQTLTRLLRYHQPADP